MNAGRPFLRVYRARPPHSDTMLVSDKTLVLLILAVLLAYCIAASLLIEHRTLRQARTYDERDAAPAPRS